LELVITLSEILDGTLNVNSEVLPESFLHLGVSPVHDSANVFGINSWDDGVF